MSFRFSETRGILARHISRTGFPRAQRIRFTLALVHAKHLQCMGLCILQCWCLRYSLRYVLCPPPAHPTIILRASPFFALSGHTSISTRSEISFVINALIIVSTIYAQDFRDEIGDKRMGRRTIPILWPEGSRIGIFMALVTWSIGLSWACELGWLFAVPFCVLAMFVGLRFLWKRTAEADQRSYRYYNVQLLIQAKPLFDHSHNIFRQICRYGLQLLKLYISP